MTESTCRTAPMPRPGQYLMEHPRRVFLDISTAHLSPETIDVLDMSQIEAWPVSGGRMRDGYFIYAHDEDSENNIPDDLWNCCVKAREMECEYIMFDRDAPELDGLATYEHG